MMRRHLSPFVVLVVAMLSGCLATVPTVVLKRTFEGPLPQSRWSGPIRLDLAMFTQKNERLAEDSVAMASYRFLAEDALRQIGFSPSPAAETVIRVELRGRTGNGLIEARAALARNVVNGALSLGTCCTTVDYIADAQGHITISKNGREIAGIDSDFAGRGQSCESVFSSSRRTDQRTAMVRVYEKAAADHIGTWLRAFSGE